MSQGQITVAGRSYATHRSTIDNAERRLRDMFRRQGFTRPCSRDDLYEAAKFIDGAKDIGVQPHCGFALITNDQVADLLVAIATSLVAYEGADTVWFVTDRPGYIAELVQKFARPLCDRCRVLPDAVADDCTDITLDGRGFCGRVRICADVPQSARADAIVIDCGRYLSREAARDAAFRRADSFSVPAVAGASYDAEPDAVDRYTSARVALENEAKRQAIIDRGQPLPSVSPLEVVDRFSDSVRKASEASASFPVNLPSSTVKPTGPIPPKPLPPLPPLPVRSGGIEDLLNDYRPIITAVPGPSPTIAEIRGAFNAMNAQLQVPALVVDYDPINDKFSNVRALPQGVEVGKLTKFDGSFTLRHEDLIDDTLSPAELARCLEVVGLSGERLSDRVWQISAQFADGAVRYDVVDADSGADAIAKARQKFPPCGERVVADKRAFDRSAILVSTGDVPMWESPPPSPTYVGGPTLSEHCADVVRNACDAFGAFAGVLASVLTKAAEALFALADAFGDRIVRAAEVCFGPADRYLPTDAQIAARCRSFKESVARRACSVRSFVPSLKGSVSMFSRTALFCAGMLFCTIAPKFVEVRLPVAPTPAATQASAMFATSVVDAPPVVEPWTEVELIGTHRSYESETGDVNSRTSIVQAKDGRRFFIVGEWGRPGDTFRAPTAELRTTADEPGMLAGFLSSR